MKEWFSVAEFAGIEKIHKSTITRRIKSKQIKFREIQINKGGRDGIAYEIHRDSLSAAKKIELEVNDKEITAEMMDWPEWKLNKTLERLRILEKAMAIMGRNKIGRLKELGTKYNISLGTLLNWIKTYKKDGILGLAPGYGKTSGMTWSVPEKLQEFIYSAYCRDEQPFKLHVYDDVRQFCKEQGIKLPSYRTVCRFIDEKIKDADKVLLRLGPRAYKDKYEPVMRRDFDDLEVNEIWCLDHREFDVFVYKNEKRKRISRPWITAQMDLKSRTLVGWHISFQPNSNTIALGIRHGIINYGKPDEVYLDNGKDYKSHYLNGRDKKIGKVAFNLQTQGVFARLGIKPRFTWPYSGRSKPIEPFFNNFPKRFERYLPGWCGRDNKERPEKLNREIKAGKLLTINEFKDQVSKFIQDYNNKIHSETEKAPNDFYKNAKVTRVDEDSLTLLLMKMVEKTYYNTGLHLLGAWYRSLELNRKIQVGEKVDVYYDPDNIDFIYVYKKGEFLCKVGIEAALSMHASEEDFKYMARLRKDARAQIAKQRTHYKFIYSKENALAEAKKYREKVNKEDPINTPPTAGKVVTLFGDKPEKDNEEPANEIKIKKPNLLMKNYKKPPVKNKKIVFFMKGQR